LKIIFRIAEIQEERFNYSRRLFSDVEETIVSNLISLNFLIN